jgi:hypothetical protein
MENNWSQRTGLCWLSFAINFRRSWSYFLLSGAPVLKLCTLDSKSREAQVLDVLNGFAVRNELPEESVRFPFQGDNEYEGDFVKDFAKLSAYVKSPDSSSVLLPVEARITRAESSAGECTVKIALVASATPEVSSSRCLENSGRFLRGAGAAQQSSRCPRARVVT